MKIAIGSDHGGFKLKERIVAYLQKQKFALRDFGTFSDRSCDYPDFAYPVARAVAAGRFERGILLCGSGVGMAVAANRVRGIRAVNVSDLYTARQSREHGNANILCLAGRRLSAAKAVRIVALWLRTPFSGEARHRRRLAKLDKRPVPRAVKG